MVSICGFGKMMPGKAGLPFCRRTIRTIEPANAPMNLPNRKHPHMSGTTAELDKRRKQLVYRAGHRGIKEMDIILGEFARDCIATLDEAELDQLEALMAETDRDLFSWFSGEVAVPEQHDTPLFAAIFDHRIKNAT